MEVTKELASAVYAAAFVGLFLGLFTTYWMGHWEANSDWRSTLIERGLAQYCPDTGEWAWIGECE